MPGLDGKARFDQTRGGRSLMGQSGLGLLLTALSSGRIFAAFRAPAAASGRPTAGPSWRQRSRNGHGPQCGLRLWHSLCPCHLVVEIVGRPPDRNLTNEPPASDTKISGRPEEVEPLGNSQVTPVDDEYAHAQDTKVRHRCADIGARAGKPLEPVAGCIGRPIGQEGSDPALRDAP